MAVQDEPMPKPTDEHKRDAADMLRDMEKTWRKTMRNLLLKLLINKARTLAIAWIFTLGSWFLTMAFMSLGFWVLGAIFGHETRWTNLSYPAWFAGVSIASLFFTLVVWAPLGHAMRRFSDETDSDSDTDTATASSLFRV